MRILLGIGAGFAFVLLVFLLLFQIYRDDIAKKILLSVNTVQNGELVFNDISFAPFVHFPDVSIDLNGSKYFEKKDVFRASDSIPIIRLQHLYLAIDVLDLLKGNVDISKVYLSDGLVNLVTYNDSTLNLINAIGSGRDSLQPATDSIKKIPTDFSLDLNKIALQNIRLKYNNIPGNSESDYTVNSLTASLNYWPDTIKCQLTTQINIEAINVADKFDLKDKSMSLETSLKFNREAKQLLVDPSKFSFELANFTTSGSVNFANDGFIKLAIKGDDKDFSLLGLLLTKTGMENIKGGKLYFDGKVNGMLFKGIPVIDLRFGMNDVNIQIPNTNKLISNLNLEGEFHSGNLKDFSEAHLSISKVKAALPGGKLDGKFAFSNFHSPEVDLDFYLKSDVTGFNQVFDMGAIDSLTGTIEIKSLLSGVYNSDSNSFNDKSGNTVVKFDSLSFLIPGVNNISNIYGRIELENDSTYFKDLNLEIGKSDFNINGNLTNILYLLTDDEKTIDGKLHIKSNMYDYPDFFAYDPRTAKAFPYKIKNVNLFVSPSTTTSHLTEFINSPEIVFQIEHLEAEIEDFLPPVVIDSGLFTLGDSDSSLNLDFTDFKIELAGSTLHTDVVFNSPQSDPSWLKVDLKAENLNPKSTFVYWIPDTIPEFMDGQLDGKMKLDLVMSNDSIQFDLLDFNATKLNYVNAKDTFDLYNFRIKTEQINYDLSVSPNILETLTLNMNLTGDTIHTNYFRVNNVNDEIVAKDGVYQITPNNSQLFDKKAKTLILLKPFEETPSYEFNLKVEQFDVAALFETFMEDTVLLGKMDIDIQLKLAGQGLEEVEKNMNGKIFIYGNDLTLLGIDIDKMVERLERSERFTLADVGAVVLMGPVGLLVTKGSDYASLVILSPGDSSHIVEASSKWEITNGLIDLTDVAVSTNENRLAAKGGINLGADTLNVQFALINNQGCSVFGQSVKGSLKDPKMGKLRVVKALISPVTNLIKIVDDGKCEVFYDGVVRPPQLKKEGEVKRNQK